MAGFNEASDYGKFLVFLLVINLVIHVVSFGSPYWTTRMDGNAGLWTGCTDGVCYERWNQWVVGWIKAGQTCMTLSLIGLSFSTILVLLFVFQRSFDRDKRLIALSLLLMTLTALLTTIAVVTWAAGEHLSSGEALNWPYALAWLSALCSVMSVPLLWKELRTEDFYDRELQRKDQEDAAAARRGKEMGYFYDGPMGAPPGMGGASSMGQLGGPSASMPSMSHLGGSPSGTLNYSMSHSQY